MTEKQAMDSRLLCSASRTEATPSTSRDGTQGASSTLGAYTTIPERTEVDQSNTQYHRAESTSSVNDLTGNGSTGHPLPVYSSGGDDAVPSTSHVVMEEASGILVNYARNATGTGEREQQVFCGVCGKISSRRDVLHGQASEHTGDKGHICSVCDPSSVDKPKFVEHCRNRAVENHKCDMCDKLFHRAQHLAVHYRTHTGERPYKCDYM
ncbi:endothelial zinc finger protein induced by tumor necrosis factor alpha-like [Dermacentor silvarum]|uniref:endothelial zinc finger protein induced by tumor necrosis factor alpha-like n=1 Tax=Dermacentor silvarum TaxID=543639 RepID=UPI0021017E84|nr:endothelial zinc finger protein induced by tumor necrosis factor alpha-like [Dermacentor silvarum]